MSYKRLKRIIKKLTVQRKEADERHMRALHAGGQLSSEQIAKMQADKDQVNFTKSPIVQSYSPMLSQKTTPEQDGGKKASKPPTHNLGLPGTPPQPQPASGSPALSSSKGSPQGLLLGGDAYQEFFSVLESDLEKVNRFYASKLADLTAQYDELHKAGHHDLHQRHGSTSSGGRERKGSDSSPTGEEILAEEAAEAEAAKSSAFASSVARMAAWMKGSKKSSSSTLTSRTKSTSDLNYGSLESGGAEAKEHDELLSPTHHTISISQQKVLEDRLQKLLDLYRPALQLQIYSVINYEGLRKIVKKLDKNTGEEHSAEWVTRLDEQSFRDTTKLNALIAHIEDLYTKWNCKRPNQDIWSSQGMLRGVKREVDNPTEEDEQAHQMSVLYVLLALVVGCIILLLPILPHEPRAKSCAALLGMITVLWVSEAVPFFVAAMCIPFSVVVLGILADPTGTPLAAEQASKAAFGFMFNDTTMLILGGFSISAAFSKCNFELRIASMIQRAFGDRPRLFLLAFMMLGCFLSCWISNIAAPVLLTSLLLPIVRDFGSSSEYSRAMLLGLAISCNIGGMMSPISSPQNAIALGYLEAAIPGQSISFTRWLCVTFPFCFVLVILAWIYLLVAFLRNNEERGEEVTEIPMIVFEKTPLDRQQVTVMAVTLGTIVLWCTLSETSRLFGEMGTIAVIPIVIFFGTGILNKADLLGFSWNLILLIGGGNVLGAAVNSSQLLHIISQALAPYLAGHSAYVTTVTVLLAVWLVRCHAHAHAFPLCSLPFVHSL